MKALSLITVLSFILPMSLSAKDETSWRIEKLKAKILTIAKNSESGGSNKLQVRNILDPLVNQLVELSPSQTEAERAQFVVGPWKSLWSDQVFGFGVDNDQVYQVVSEDGYYYNISKVVTERGVFTNFLRGAYQTQGSYLAIEFTANELTQGFFPSKTDLASLAADFESGEYDSFSIPGPIGVTGVLMNIYADQTLRIVYGNSSTDSRPRLFILERVNSIL